MGFSSFWHWLTQTARGDPLRGIYGGKGFKYGKTGKAFLKKRTFRIDFLIIPRHIARVHSKMYTLGFIHNQLEYPNPLHQNPCTSKPQFNTCIPYTSVSPTL